MVALEKYQDCTTAFLEAVRGEGRDITVSERTLYVYETGSWSIVNNSQQDDLDRLLKEVCDANNFPFAEKYPQLWRNIKASLKPVDHRRFDASGLIALRNGTLDPTTLDLTEHDADDMITRRADVAYDAHAKCPEWLKMLDRIVEGKSELSQREYKEFLQCWFGVALVGYRNLSGRQFRKLVALNGPERSGKSTVADVIRKLIGEGDTAAEDLETISTRFGLSNIARAKALIADDAAGRGSKVSSMVLKKLITGEPMTADRKMRDPVNFRFQGPILITTNNLPKIEDSTHALYGRFEVLTFDRQFGTTDAALLDNLRPEQYLEKKKEYPGILNWALQGLAKVTERGSLPTVTEAVAAVEVWRGDNDPVYGFLKEYCEYDEHTLNYVTVIASAISVYAEMQLSDRSYPPRKCKTLVTREAKQVIPGVMPDRRQFHKVQTRCLLGLKINEEGRRYIKLAHEKGLLEASAQWKVNDRAL